MFRVVKADELFSDVAPVPGVAFEDGRTAAEAATAAGGSSSSAAVEAASGEGHDGAVDDHDDNDEEDEDVVGDRETLVVDARHDASLELLARAWCSWKGEHAVIGRVKVTCLACCVREARALGIRIIIRVE